MHLNPEIKTLDNNHAFNLTMLAISGSPRRGGNTELLLDEAIAGAKSRNVSVEKIIISELYISPCIECNDCFKSGRCSIKDDFQGLYDKIIKTDRIIVASPIFFMGVSAQLKAFIDRCQCFWAANHILKINLFTPAKIIERMGAFFSTAGTKGKKVFDGALYTMKYFFHSIRMEYSFELLIREINEAGAILKSPEWLDKAYEIGIVMSERR